MCVVKKGKLLLQSPYSVMITGLVKGRKFRLLAY